MSCYNTQMIRERQDYEDEAESLAMAIEARALELMHHGEACDPMDGFNICEAFGEATTNEKMVMAKVLAERKFDQAGTQHSMRPLSAWMPCPSAKTHRIALPTGSRRSKNELALPNTSTNTVDSKANQRIRATTTRTTARGSVMKIEEQTTPISEYEIYTPKVYVAVYYYKNSQTPFAFTSDSKEQLLQSMKNFHALTSFDESRPVKIFTLNC